MRRSRRLWLLAAVGLGAALAVGLHGPIAQDAGYHHFADRRTLLGVPNLWNVVSNLLFLFVGLVGLARLASRPAGVLPGLRPAYAAFFAGAVLVSAGSAWYHLHPDDASLAWDRIPMTLAFMAFFAIVLGEHVDPSLGRRALLPLLLIGPASVLSWSLTGDLRPYVLVQYLPVVLIPLIVVLLPSALEGVSFIWVVLASYALAKALELLDAPVYRAIGLSGHTLKHLVAAAGMSVLVVAIRRRRPA